MPVFPEMACGIFRRALGPARPYFLDGRRLRLRRRSAPGGKRRPQPRYLPADQQQRGEKDDQAERAAEERGDAVKYPRTWFFRPSRPGA